VKKNRDDNTCYGKELCVMVGMTDVIVLPGFADTTGSRQRFTNRAIKNKNINVNDEFRTGVSAYNEC
jgi:hypothetical protein